ncbi:MAG: tetratricopeptide repeat protein, partial [Promethearchaeota archaeon]
MTNSASEKLALVRNLINEGKIEDALRHVIDIEKMENLTSEETLRTLYFKGRSYFQLGKSDISLKIAKELYQKSQELKMPLFSLDAFALEQSVLYSGGLPSNEFYTNLKRYDNLFNSIPREESLEFQEREAYLLFWQSARDYNMGKLDLALNTQFKSLALIRRVDPHSSLIPYSLMSLAFAYQMKGELNLALESAEEALSLIPEGDSTTLISRKEPIYRIIGYIYFTKGELNRALEYYILALEIQKKVDRSGGWVPYPLIIETLLAQKNISQARNYLQQFREFNEKKGSKASKLGYQYAHALILKSSSRMRDHTEAETIFKKLIEEDYNILLTINALKNLCELYFEEFRFSNQMEILDDIQQLIKHLQRYARRIKSYFLIATVKLLQAKLALLQVSMVKARKLLTEAQQVADEHDLQLLAGEISKEHDHLLDELKLWESFKKEQASVAERLKLASIDNVIERLQGRREIDLFSYPFSDKWKRDDDLFGSFLSAFSTFTDDFFSKGLDRVKFGDDTILLQSVGMFSICYLFQGQTYFAKEKLEKFA